MATYRWTEESTVILEAKSSVHPIHGETHAVRGEVSGEVQGDQIMLDPMPTGYIEVDIDALKSGNKLEDFEMRRRVEAKKYPTIRFDLRSATGGPEKYRLKCALTFHGVTQEFEEDATARISNGALQVEGQHTFNIEEFGVKAPKILNLQVYPEITIIAKMVGKPA
ncbi:MAG: YceI family protein [Actinomycetota bacterium]